MVNATALYNLNDRARVAMASIGPRKGLNEELDSRLIVDAQSLSLLCYVRANRHADWSLNIFNP